MSDEQVKYANVELPVEEADMLPFGGEGERDASLPLTEEEIESEVVTLIREAVEHSDDLGKQRTQASDYYFGRPFGDEQEGRSQVVATEVKDAVDAALPSLMRTFFGPDRVVEFEPRTAEDIDGAQQATEYVNFIIESDNNGVIEIHNALKDALVRRFGVVKYWWDDITDTRTYTLNGQTEDDLVMLDSDPAVEFSVVGQYEWIDPIALTAYKMQQMQYDAAIEQLGTLPQGAPPPEPPQPVMLYDVEVTVTEADGRCRIASVPPEEFLFSPDARSVKDSTLIGHRKDMRRSDLIAMGFSEDDLTDVGSVARNRGGASSELRSNLENITRTSESVGETSEASGANDIIPVYEVYVYIDMDGDGVTEHRKMILAGASPRMLANEPCAGRPFAFFEVDPEPHTMVGMSLADRTMDLQLIKSKLLRGALDSLAFSLHPRTVVVEGEASLADVMNSEIGAVIRERQPGMVREFTHTFNGQAALPFLQYFDEMKQARTGVSKAAAGLDPDSLQSSTRAAVAATVAGAQQRLELYARMLAETGLRPLMRGILQTVCEHQQQVRLVRLRNRHVEVDPRAWNADMDVKINVAIGYTVIDERINRLAGIAAKQAEILMQMGPGNPFVTYGQYANTLNQIARLSGYSDSSQFFNTLPIQSGEQPPQPQPKPEDILAQAQAQKVQSDAQLQAKELEIKAQEIQLREDRERQRIEAELFLKAKEMELKYAAKVEETRVKMKQTQTKAPKE
jgi:hypothetical protein